MIYLTCKGCRQSGALCERRLQWISALKSTHGLGGASIRFRCPDKLAPFRPGLPVCVPRFRGDDNGRCGQVVRFTRAGKVSVWFPGHHDANQDIDEEILNLWPNQLKDGGHNGIDYCPDCGMPNESMLVRRCDTC